MLIIHNSNEWEYYSESHICEYHKKNPGINYAGCGCSGTVGMRKKEKKNESVSKVI